MAVSTFQPPPVKDQLPSTHLNLDRQKSPKPNALEIVDPVQCRQGRNIRAHLMTRSVSGRTSHVQIPARTISNITAEYRGHVHEFHRYRVSLYKPIC